MKFTLDKKILAGFTGCILVLCVVAYISFKNSEKFVSTSAWVNHTHEVINGFEKVQVLSVECEIGMRGFVITGMENFLEPYRKSSAQLDEHFSKMKDLTKDNSIQQKNVDTLQRLSAKSIAFLQKCIEIKRLKGTDSASASIKSGEGKMLLDGIRRVIENAENVEYALLGQRKKENEADANDFNRFFILLLAVFALVLLIVYFVIVANLRALRRAEKETAEKNWSLAGSRELVKNTQGNKDVEPILNAIIHHLATYLNAQVGALYIVEENPAYLRLAAGYAINKSKKEKLIIKKGEGVIGQVARDNKGVLVEDIPENYFNVSTGIGEIIPKNILVVPFALEGEVKGVIELGSVSEFTELQKQYVDFVVDSIAIAVTASQAREKMKELLEETQQQAEELEVQQEELKQTNEELIEKSKSLEMSEAELRAQQEELKQNNEELEEKTNLLEDQKEKLEKAKAEIESKANELEVTGKYKSEFLANMSHELRTPLNSVLILSQLLSENKNNVLGEKEIEFARNIYNSGTDLLNLINEILDLSKIESGKMELEIVETDLKDVEKNMFAVFSQIAKSKSVGFKINIDPSLKNTTLITEKQKLEQILKNLLSNAFKFTPKNGEVVLSVSKTLPSVEFKNKKLGTAENVISFSVSDTGIGIPRNKWAVVFEAFQQVDGSTKRKYGGTGLGLSISRELATVMGGEIHLQSEEGKGSTFTLYLPVKFEESLVETENTNKQFEIKRKQIRDEPKSAREELPSDEQENIGDDRNDITEKDKVILIIEDDTEFAKVLLEFIREKKYKGVIAQQGRVGLNYARNYKPDAIILDIKMPVMDGMLVLKQLKIDPALRHIPVQIISSYDRRKEGMELGAFDYVSKPVTTKALQKVLNRIGDFVNKKVKKLLIVEDNEEQNAAIREIIGNGDVKCFSAYTGTDAYNMLNNEWFDCIIVDLGLPDMSGFDLLEKIKANTGLNRIPVVVYTGKDLTKEESAKLAKLSSTVVLKTADSKERLLDETILFLHRVESNLPKEKQSIIRKLHKTDEVLKNKKVLIADDDIRNIYSLTSALEEQGLNCIVAENGKIAVESLQADPSIDLVLMDIMMPEMDGYEATKEIRKIKKFDTIPIIALTAKAMKGDKEKCLAVGMSDYVAKPVNIEQLLALMRVWLYR